MPPRRSPVESSESSRRSGRVAALLLALVLGIIGAWLVQRTFLYLASGEGRHRAETAALWFGALAVLGWARHARFTAAEPRARPPFVVGALLIPLVVALFHPALAVGLLSDDFVLLPSGAACGERAWAFFRPLPVGLWGAMDMLLAQGSVPIVLHAINLVLHATNAALVGWLASLVGLSRRAAAFAAVAFAVFPASVEAVVWAAGVQDVLLTTGVLLFVIGLIQQRSLQMAVGLVVALASKETGVIAPVLGFTLVVGTDTWRRMVTPLGIAAALCLAYGIARIVSVPSTAALRIDGGYGLKELLTRPFATLVLPWTGDQLAAAPVPAVLGLAALLGVVLVTASVRPPVAQRAALLVRCTGWIVLGVVPIAGMFFIDSDLEGSRYLYLPLVGFTIALAGMGSALPAHFAGVLGAALLVLYAAGVRLHIEPWGAASVRRDVTLASVRAQLARTDDEVLVRDVPDTVRGAFVFRNGLREAIARDLGCEAAARVRVE